ncbi:MAG: hypothetical protein ACRETS_11880, partial [Steroidobacteraceae bacterium]
MSSTRKSLASRLPPCWYGKHGPRLPRVQGERAPLKGFQVVRRRPEAPMNSSGSLGSRRGCCEAAS